MKRALFIFFTFLTTLTYAKDGILIESSTQLIVYDLKSKSQVAHLKQDMLYFGGVAVDAENAVAYVRSTNGLLIFDIKTNKVIESIPANYYRRSIPNSIALSPDRRFVYWLDDCVPLTSDCTNKIVIFDLLKKAEVNSISLEEVPTSFALSPNGKNIVVAYPNLGSLSVFSVETLKSYMDIPLEAKPNNVRFSSNDRMIYFAQDNDTVGIFDLIARRVVAKIPVGHNPQGLAVSPDGSRVYVSCNSFGGNISIIDAQKKIGTGSSPCPYAEQSIPVSCDVKPDSSKLFCYVQMYDSDVALVLNKGADCVGEPDEFAICIEPEFKPLGIFYVNLPD